MSRSLCVKDSVSCVHPHQLWCRPAVFPKLQFLRMAHTFCHHVPGLRTCSALQHSWVMVNLFSAMFALTRRSQVIAMPAPPESASVMFIVVYTFRSLVLLVSTAIFLASVQLFILRRYVGLAHDVYRQTNINRCTLFLRVTTALVCAKHNVAV